LCAVALYVLVLQRALHDVAISIATVVGLALHPALRQLCLLHLLARRAHPQRAVAAAHAPLLLLPARLLALDLLPQPLLLLLLLFCFLRSRPTAQGSRALCNSSFSATSFSTAAASFASRSRGPSYAS
jgi:hypothetical protein